MERVFRFINKNFYFIVTFFIFSLINYFFTVKMNADGIINGHNSMLKLVVFIELLIEVILFVLLYFYNKKKWKLEFLFLILGGLFGLLYMIIIPMWGVPDEPNHFFRAYEISEGGLISDINNDGKGGHEFDQNLTNIANIDIRNYTYKDILDRVNIKPNNGEKVFVSFSNTSLYSFFCYLPQTFGIIIGKIFHLPLIVDAYLGRIINYIVWLLFMFCSIKIIPVAKKTLFLISFLPMMMQEAISLSPDAMTNAVSICLLSYVLYLSYDKKKSKLPMTKNQLIKITLLTILMSLLKIVYLPLCLLLFIIPHTKFKSFKDKMLKIGGVAFLVIVLNLIWLKISSVFLIEYNTGVNASEQVKFILTNPYSYLKVFFNTVDSNLIYYINLMGGTSMGWLNIAISEPYIIFYLLLILYYSICEKELINLKTSSKKLILFICVSVIVLIFTSLYVQWTPLKNGSILGIQGRYFLPILLPILILLKNDKIKLNTDNSIINVYMIMSMLNVYVLTILFFTYIY